MTSTPRRLTAVRARSLGSLTAGTLRLHESIDSAWQHLCDGLKALADKGTDDQVTLNENALTQRLLTELEQVSWDRPYFFQKEFMEDDSTGNSRRTDVAVQARQGACVVVDGIGFSNGKRFLALEAKRLPAPRNDREREYLIGEHGGIERFKKGDHGRELKTVGIIGYIQRHAFDYWRDRINGWIDQLIPTSLPELPWDLQDRLDMEENSPQLARLQSRTLRVSDNKRITVRHLWVQMATGAAQSSSPSRQHHRRTSAR